MPDFLKIPLASGRLPSGRNGFFSSRIFHQRLSILVSPVSLGVGYVESPVSASSIAGLQQVSPGQPPAPLMGLPPGVHPSRHCVRPPAVPAVGMVGKSLIRIDLTSNLLPSTTGTIQSQYLFRFANRKLTRRHLLPIRHSGGRPTPNTGTLVAIAAIYRFPPRLASIFQPSLRRQVVGTHHHAR